MSQLCRVGDKNDIVDIIIIYDIAYIMNGTDHFALSQDSWVTQMFDNKDKSQISCCNILSTSLKSENTSN